MIKLLQGDCREILPSLPDKSVHCVVTSPPYFGLRSYLDADHADKAMEIGTESTPDLYVAGMVAVFRQIRRVLRDDGCVWLNLGDGYNNRTKVRTSSHQPALNNFVDDNWADRAQRGGVRMSINSGGIKEKDLMMIPARVAIALQVDGWYLRSQLPWIKRSCMPESVVDRPSNAVEYVYMLTKSGSTTFWSHRDGSGARSQPAPDWRWINKATGEELLEPPEGMSATGDKTWRRLNLWSSHDYFYDNEAIKQQGAIPAGTRAAKGSDVRSELKDVNGRPPEYWDYTGTRAFRNTDLFFESLEQPHGAITDDEGNIIALDVNPQGYDAAHFATFPPRLIEPLIKAGSSERGCCPDCGAPWKRIVEKTRSFQGNSAKAGRTAQDLNETGKWHNGGAAGNTNLKMGPCIESTTKGWQPTCACPEAEPIPCTMLDPFGGAGTTAMVADRLGRSALSIDLNATYVTMGRDRITNDAGLFAQFS
jgi:DNA modification methylase